MTTIVSDFNNTMTRRSLCGFAVLAPLLAKNRTLSADLLPQQFADPLGVNAAWFERQAERQQLRIAHGSAEHIAYYLLQSKSFTSLPPTEPMRAANGKLPFPQLRAEHLLAAKPQCERHRLIRNLYDGLKWPLERCYEHTISFLRAKEIDQSPLDPLYQARGLSSDTSPDSLTGLSSIDIPAKRVLLAGPGLDLTRREKFSDNLPLKSYQLDYLRARYPLVDAVDIRPEVIDYLGATSHDLTTQILPAQYDLIIATNVFVYLNDAELLCALTGLSLSLPPGGLLVHNDTRFAAKVFGEALHLPVEKYAPVSLGGRKWDRLVIHQKGPQ